MKVGELIRFIENNGWVEVRQSGSHKIFKHPIKKGLLSIPFHKCKEIPTGTLISILKKAGLK
jgi:predicted RNA binding protein YcfA (HicA-like mRNA interferase family)